MAQPAKFLFDRRFDDLVPEIDEEVSLEQKLRAQFEDQLLQAREMALQEGRKEGEEAALKSLDAQTLQTLDKIFESATASAHEIDETCGSIRADALRLAVIAADKLASGLLGRDPTAILEKLFDECFELVCEAPHVAIRVNDAIAEKIQSSVRDAAKTKGFEGEILVIPDPDIALGDGKLEWADGGASRSYQEIQDQIDQSVAHFLDLRSIAPSSKHSNGELNGQSKTHSVELPKTDDSADELGEIA